MIQRGIGEKEDVEPALAEGRDHDEVTGQPVPEVGPEAAEATRLRGREHREAAVQPLCRCAPS